MAVVLSHDHSLQFSLPTILFDITKAFDSVDRALLWRKLLAVTTLPMTLLTYEVPNGVVQGSVLDSPYPLLTLYADDIKIATPNPIADTAIIEKYLAANNLSLSISKTVPIGCTTTIQNTSILPQQTAIYLGLPFCQHGIDSKLHLNNRIHLAQQALKKLLVVVTPDTPIQKIPILLKHPYYNSYTLPAQASATYLGFPFLPTGLDSGAHLKKRIILARQALRKLLVVTTPKTSAPSCLSLLKQLAFPFLEFGLPLLTLTSRDCTKLDKFAVWCITSLVPHLPECPYRHAILGAFGFMPYKIRLLYLRTRLCLRLHHCNNPLIKAWKRTHHTTPGSCWRTILGDPEVKKFAHYMLQSEQPKLAYLKYLTDLWQQYLQQHTPLMMSINPYHIPLINVVHKSFLPHMLHPFSLNSVLSTEVLSSLLINLPVNSPQLHTLVSKLQHEQSSVFSVPNGVVQGSVLADCLVTLFADDIRIFSSNVQQDSQTIHQYLQKSNLQLSIAKTVSATYLGFPFLPTGLDSGAHLKKRIILARQAPHKLLGVTPPTTSAPSCHPSTQATALSLTSLQYGAITTLVPHLPECPYRHAILGAFGLMPYKIRLHYLRTRLYLRLHHCNNPLIKAWKRTHHTTPGSFKKFAHYILQSEKPKLAYLKYLTDL
ncbi:hypothetical protein K493DRAFT_348252 [Basidiobolus meristosporus CBS 931.73]|uniref:Reverse transcriptase domain-containing protein n=1 Tax=Basidiobolus meristosporus CBS 931.73 TaxID=1314790 RepID=A0A1Y1YQB9_9FUNG|nr:hypothetical protein K493DRAFT_348252 [Basidiobolus meristosporus CBS 931.73]|eukprot:ORX99946.1 hypothetical protein K493DRAFT_348252 [Basidiobolus meristosporus CBS 931.73]